MRNIKAAWGEGTATKTTVYRWFHEFRSGGMSLGDEPGRGHKSSLINDQLKAAVEVNPETTTRALAADLEAQQSTVAHHMPKIGKPEELQKWIPHELNDFQKFTRFLMRSNLLVRFKNEPFSRPLDYCG